MITFYGGDLSAPCNKVRFALNYLGLDYDYKRVSIKDRENRTESYLKMHPAGKIPVLDDGGFILFESNAIIKYLAVKNKSGLYPKEIKEQAIVDQWMDFISMHIGAAMGRVVFNRIFAPIIPAEVDEASLKTGLGFLGKFLPVMDQQLKKTKYAAGSTMTTADINLLATLDPAELAGIDLAGYSNISAWRNKLKKEKFYTKCYASYGESLKQMTEKS